MARDFSKFRKVELTETSQASEPMGVPAGYTVIRGAQVYFSKEKKRLAVTAEPLEDADTNGEVHNCDANGCGWEHLIAVLELNDQQVKEFDMCGQDRAR